MNIDLGPTISKRLLEIKGNLSYRDLQQAIQAKTGRRITFSMLQQIGSGGKRPGLGTISVLAEYAGRPVSWFFEQEMAAVHEPRDPYQLETRPGQEARRTLIAKITSGLGRIESVDDLAVLAELVEKMADRGGKTAGDVCGRASPGSVGEDGNRRGS